MSNPGVDVAALPHRDLGLVFVFDSSTTTAMFWRQVFQHYVGNMITRLTKMHVPPTKHIIKLRVALVVYSRSDSRPSLLFTQYFNTLEQTFKDISESLVDIHGPNSIGIGRTTSASTVGMSVLEGLVAGVEMMDCLFAEATNQPFSLPHPNIPTPPKRELPIRHLILVASSPPGGARTPLENLNSEFDEVTLDTLPAEILKRNIHFSLLSPIHVQELVSFHAQTTGGLGSDPLWFKVAPGHSVLISGFSDRENSGQAPIAMKRSVSNTTHEADSPAGKKAQTESPQVQIRATPLAQVTTPHADLKPPSLEAMDTSPQALFRTPPAPTPSSAQDNMQRTQEYQRLMAQKAQAQINQMASSTVAAPTAASSHVAAATATGAMPVLNQTTFPIAGVQRPPSQPQHGTPQLQQQQQPQPPKSHMRSQSEATPHPSQPPSTSHSSPTVQLRTPKQRGETVPIPSPRPVSQASSGSMNDPSSIQGFAATVAPSIPQQLPSGPVGANAAHLQQLAMNNNLMLQAQQATAAHQQNYFGGDNQMLQQQQRALLAKMSAHGVLAGSSTPNSGSETPGATSDLWQGPLAFNFPDPQNPATPKSKQIWVSARSLQPKERPAQFPLWPQQLSFNYHQFRVIDHAKISTYIKEKTIPLCLFNPNSSNFGGNMDITNSNERSYRDLVTLLATKQAGICAYFPHAARVEGSGVLLFTNKELQLLGAAFLTTPIPQLAQHPEFLRLLQAQPAAAHQMNQMNQMRIDETVRNNLVMQAMQRHQAAQAAQVAQAQTQQPQSGLAGSSQIAPQAQAQNRALGGGGFGMNMPTSGMGLGPNMDSAALLQNQNLNQRLANFQQSQQQVQQQLQQQQQQMGMQSSGMHGLGGIGLGGGPSGMNPGANMLGNVGMGMGGNPGFNIPAPGPTNENKLPAWLNQQLVYELLKQPGMTQPLLRTLLSQPNLSQDMVRNVVQQLKAKHDQQNAMNQGQLGGGNM